jgi:VWFA-related protein
MARLCFLALGIASIALFAPAQTVNSAPEDPSRLVIRAETRLVLVDAVIRDKRGKPVRDLAAQDFRLWEDGKPRTIESFSQEASSASPEASQKHYLVFFFDNSTTPVSDQFAYRRDAARFAAAWAGPDRYMAVANFFGTVAIAQNFTTAAGPLARALGAVQAGIPSVDAFAATTGSPSIRRNASTARDQNGCSMVQLIQKTCAPSDAPAQPVQQDAANPGAARGVFDGLMLVADSLASVRGRKALVLFSGGFAEPPSSVLMAAVTEVFNRANVALYTVKQPGLKALADQTGGRAIANANDLVGELGRIADEQEEHYVLGFSPGELPEGSCHSLRIEISRPGLDVQARKGYCSSKPVDLLAGNTASRTLEERAAGASAGNLTASLQLPYFYSSPNAARVNVAMEIRTAGIKFQKVKGKPHAELKVAGVAYRPGGDVAGRFSDVVQLDFETDKEAAAFAKQPYHYEYQFDLGPGEYSLRVAFSAGGENFGKAEMPLSIAPWDGRRLALSGIAFAKESRPVPDLASALDDSLLEDRRPLIAGSRRIVPSGSNRFHGADQALVYAEIYEPLLAGPNPPSLGLQIRVVDRQGGEVKASPEAFSVTNFIRPGNPVVPVAFSLPLASLAPGSYRLELNAVHSSGPETALSAVDFEVE